MPSPVASFDVRKIGVNLFLGVAVILTNSSLIASSEYRLASSEYRLASSEYRFSCHHILSLVGEQAVFLLGANSRINRPVCGDIRVLGSQNMYFGVKGGENRVNKYK